MSKRVYTMVALTAAAAMLAGRPLQAQTLSVPQMRGDLTMRDMENDAARRTLNRAPADSEAGLGSHNNLFQVSQTGDHNTVDARQSGANNIIQIVQIGQMNTATVAQSGLNNSVTLRQER